MGRPDERRSYSRRRWATLAVFAGAVLCLTANRARAVPIYNPATGHWYEVVEGDWFAAEAAAQALGGHLVTVDDQAEQDWLVATFGPFSNTPVPYDPNRYWIGLREQTVDGPLIWASGAPVTFTAWYPGEPNNYADGSLSAVYLGRYADGRWNDGPADRDASFGIAELTSLPLPVPEPRGPAVVALLLLLPLLARLRA